MMRQINLFLRNLARKPIYSFITFTGFTVGIMAGLLIYLWVFNELSYEKFHPGYERIYRVLTLGRDGDKIVKSANSYRPLAKTMKADYGQIEYATYLSFSSENSPLQKESGGEKIEAAECWTNDDFFYVFEGYTFIEGTREKAFANPSNIVLSEKVAHQLFGSETALGKNLISDKYDKRIYTVGGVVQVPKLSHINFGFLSSEKRKDLLHYASDWHDKAFVHTYIKVKQTANLDSEFIKNITNHISRYSNISDKLMFQPITDIHLHTDYETYIFDKNISSYKYIWIFSGLALLIILMASFNFSVLSVARASERIAEIGIKKTNGASRLHILIQFMGESLIHTILAAILAFFCTSVFLPAFNNLTGQELHFIRIPQLIMNLCLLTFMVGCIAGSYPSLYLSSIDPGKTIKGGNQTGSKASVIGLLVMVQFAIAVFFIVSTMIFTRQIHYMQTKDLGIESKNIIVIPTGLWYDNRAFKNELAKNPNILGVSASVRAPVNFAWQMNMAIHHGDRIDSVKSAFIWADEEFATTYNLKILKGQFLQMDYSAYWKELEKKRKKDSQDDPVVSIPIVINETAEKYFRFDNPIGQRIGDKVIVGVVKDFNYRPLRYPIGPVVITNDPQNIMAMNVRISPLNKTQTLAFIRDAYKKYRDNREFSYNFFDDLLAEEYKEERQLRNLTILFTSLAIFISILGILGMSYFSCQRRIKEIGIRRVNGAMVSEVLVMLNYNFIKWVAIAFVIACPIAWYAMQQWLQNFAYKTELSWWVFALAGIVAVAVAVLTVSWQSWRAATRNPVESLRYE